MYLFNMGRTARTITLSEEEKRALEVASNSRKAERAGAGTVNDCAELPPKTENTG
jgi:hypothetical protein